MIRRYSNKASRSHNLHVEQGWLLHAGYESGVQVFSLQWPRAVLKPFALDQVRDTFNGTPNGAAEFNGLFEFVLVPGPIVGTLPNHMIEMWY